MGPRGLSPAGVGTKKGEIERGMTWRKERGLKRGRAIGDPRKKGA